MNDAASEHSHITSWAISSGSAMRPIGWSASTWASSGVAPEPVVDHLGSGRTRADGVDADALGRELERRRLREPDDTVLGGDVGTHPRKPDEPGSGRAVFTNVATVAVLQDARDLVLHAEGTRRSA